MEYELVYDAARAFSGWEIIAIGVPLTILLVAIYHYEIDLFLPITAPSSRSWFYLCTCFVVLLIGAASANIIYNNIKLGYISKNNNCTQISGLVTDFKPRAVRGSVEKFKLENIEFEYYTNDILNGYNTSADNGGQIYEGAKVRLCYFDRERDRRKERLILRVEVATVSVEK